MATATRKKPAKKSVRKKTAARKAPATKVRGKKVAKKKEPAPKVQRVIEGAFPDRDAELESLLANKLSKDAAQTTAKDAATTAYDALKERMRKKGLSEYFSYDRRVEVILTPEDAKLKIKPLKEDDPTPFRAG